MSSDEPGLLGNLPRSRPGTRSDKRATAPEEAELVKEPAPARRVTKSAPESAAKPKAKRVTAKRPARPTSPRPAAAAAAAPREPAAQPVRPREPEAPAGPLRSAAKVAGTGLRVAEGVTRGVLRRLPRP